MKDTNIDAHIGDLFFKTRWGRDPADRIPWQVALGDYGRYNWVHRQASQHIEYKIPIDFITLILDASLKIYVNKTELEVYVEQYGRYWYLTDVFYKHLVFNGWEDAPLPVPTVPTRGLDPSATPFHPNSRTDDNATPTSTPTIIGVEEDREIERRLSDLTGL